MAEIMPTPECRKLEDLKLADIQALSVAFIGLNEDREVPRTPDYKTMATEFDLTDWLEGHRSEGDSLDQITRVDLSVPSIYFKPEYVEWIECMHSIDSFPIIHPDLPHVEEKTGKEIFKDSWQHAFLKLHMRFGNYSPEYSAELFVQPRNSGITFAEEGAILVRNFMYVDGGGGPMNHTKLQAKELAAILVDYGRGLQET